MKSFRFSNEVFAAVFCFGTGAILRLVSSAILTRILYPEAYGIVTILGSVLVVIELTSDLGVVGLMVRHERGDDPRFINTLWVIRVVRGVLAFLVVWIAAPWIARLYGVPELESALPVFALSMVLVATESMSFIILLRRSKARVQAYTELAALLVSTIFTIIYAQYSRDHWALVYGALVQRGIILVASYTWLKDNRPRFEFDWSAARELFAFAKYVIPSSMISMVVLQYERIVFLRLFDLQRLGLVGIAANIAGSVDALLSAITRNVLFPRCSNYIRYTRETARERYYGENVKLFLLVLSFPALIGGAGHLIVEILYDDRYREAGAILVALSVRSMLTALVAPKANLVLAAGYTHAQLYSNVLRIGWLIPVSLGGYYVWGFTGFLYGAALDQVPVLIYNLYVQTKAKLIIVKYELLQVAFMLGTFCVTLGASSLVVPLVPRVRDVLFGS